MPKDRNESIPREEEATVEELDDRQKKLRRQEEDEETGSEHDSSGSDGDRARSKKKRRRHRSSRDNRRRGRRSRSESEDSTSSDSYSGSESEESGSEPESDSSESEGEARRRRRKEKRRRREREYEKERRRKKKEKERKRREEKEERKSKKKAKKKKKEKETNKKGAVTNSWGKYGIIREIDMWNKRPEFTAWLSEVKKVNLESLPNWEEKQMFKEFMEDHNTATFPSKKYYNLDAYHRRKMEKEIKKGSKKVDSERTVFDDEEQRRIELLIERERQKEDQVEALKRSMQTGMAQAMKEQSRLREEMMYQYKLGNFEAAAAIQRRLDPDVAM